MQVGIVDNQAILKERRLTRRVQKTWQRCANGRLPSWGDIRALDLGEDWNFCFTVDLRLSDGFPYFIYLGESLSRLAMVYLPDRTHREMTPVDLAAAKMDEAALSKAPVYFDEVLRLPRRRKIVFRSVLLPLSEDGEAVTHVFGAANGKGVS